MTVASNLRSRTHSGTKTVGSEAGNEAHSDQEPSDGPQVLFMDTHDVGSRTGHVPPNYYQVATPKSPHELSLTDEVEEDHPGSSNNQHRESEESERLKYETAKREILENLNLHIMLNNNEYNNANAELGRVEAQMRVLEHMHQDPALLAHVEQHQEELYAHHREQFLRKKEMEASHGSLNSGGSLDLGPVSHGASDSSNSGFFYHTRSKSTNNLNNVLGGNNSNSYQSRLRPASNKTIGMRLVGGKSLQPLEQPMATSSSGSELDPVRPSLLNQHHKRNYSSSCLTSKSGIVGSNENNEPIFKRPDGILVIIACSFCERSGFTSAQGIVNHVRLKHGTSYPSQPLAVLKNQQVLADDRQSPEIITQFKELQLNPANDYLPHVINIQTSSQTVSQKDRNNSIRELSPRAISPTTDTRPDISRKSTKHLKRLYQNDDFKEIVDYVNEAHKDLESILKQPSKDEDTEESDNEDCDDKLTSPERSSSGCTKGDRSVNQAPNPDDLNERKRSGSSDTDSKKRFKAAEKKVRPDAIALMKIPERDKRSSHYNLRAKSKLRGHSRYD
ncbi:LANO_0H11342g1_1 [Lachancea nothofagi CBS 11611]|uniref:LANO_0H11342g1_1 n=1 Tax=Lachancea nothofagi CBS 11611 TaxID=1266666 RepID=A0A1G4KM17_9SACH|nr:LANO_0H11342g1_1 [Lachancea nothofagi CBS 11611]